MYNRRKLHKFIHYYSESDKEFNKSTVKDTFWDDLCQGKLELPSGDLYSSIKTMKRKCNSYSLNEEDFWWNQLLDSPNKDDMSCDETTSKRVGRRRKRKISQTVDKDRFGMLNFSKKPKEETEVPKVGPKKRGRKKKPRPEDLETDCGDAELREGDVLSSQMESDDGSTSVTGDFPETVTRVIAPLTDDVNGMMQTDCPTPSQIIDLSIYSPGSLVEKPLNFPSAIPRSGSVASAGVERFLTGVREIFSSCGFQTRSASKVSHKEGLKLQRNLSKDRQLFQNLASIINTESGIHSPGTEQGSNIFVIDSSSEHSKSSTSSRYFTRCKVENDKQLHQDAVIDSGASVNSPAKESLKISSGIHFPLIIQGCYVKLEKLEMPKALMDGERFKYSLVNEKKNEPSVATIQPIKVCPIDNYTMGAPAEFESKEIDSKVKHVFDRQDDPRSLSDVSHPEAPRTASRFLRETSAEKPSKGVLRRSASDSLLVAFAQGRSRAVADQIASLNHKDKKEPCGRLHDFNQKRLFPKRRIIGHVIDAPAYKMSAFSRKKLKRPVARGRPLICKRRIQKSGNVFSKKDRIVCQSVKEKGDSLAVACLPEKVVEDNKIQVVHEACSKHLEREISNLSKIVPSEICEIKEPEIILPAPSTVETAENVSDAGRPAVSEVCGIMVENISPPCQPSDLEPTANQRSYEGHVNIQLSIIHVEETLRIDLPEIPGRMFQEGAVMSRSVTERCGSIVTTEGNNDLGNNLATKQQVAIPRAPVVTENRSAASDPSSIDLSAPTEVPPRALPCNVSAEKDVPRQPCPEPRKRRGNPLDPRLNGKRYQAKRSNQIKPKKLCHYNEKQLLEDCRQKLYALIAEGMLEEVLERGEGKPVAKDAEEASPAVVTNRGLDAARGAQISKSLEALNVNGGAELASSTDRRSEAEKVLPAADDAEKIAEVPHDARQAKPPVKVCKPQDPRRRSDNGAPNREAESTKDDQKDQDWVESIEGRTVPNFSSTSLWPHQLEVIPTAPAPEVIDNAVIHQAVVKGDLRVMERVMTLLPSHVNWDLEQSDEMGDTLLMVAARNDDSQMIILLRNRVNLNHKNHQRKTPLMVAAQNGRLRSVATLLDLGAHIDLRDSKGKTALLLAVENNQDHVVHLLLGRGANFCPLTLTSNNFKDTEEQERAIRINVCLNSHISWVTKYFDSAVLKWACTLGLNKLRALTAVQFMTPCQVQKFEFTFSYRPDTRLAATQERKIILFGAHCVVQYNWFDGEVPMPPELVGGVRCNGVRTASLRDSAFMLANVNKGFNVISIGIRPDLHPEPKVGSCLRDKLAFRAYELSMPPQVVEMFAKKERT